VFFSASDWLVAFALTVLVEVPVVVLMLRRRSRAGDIRLGLLALYANLASHPLVWFVFTQVWLVGTPAYVAGAESWAVGAEALFYAVALPGLSPRRAVAASIAANAISFVAGRLLRQILPDVLA
jgi:hypothetical protein